MKSSDVKRPVRCPDEFSRAIGVQLSVLRVEGAQLSSSSSGTESCRSECPDLPITVLDMYGMVFDQASASHVHLCPEHFQRFPRGSWLLAAELNGSEGE